MNRTTGLHTEDIARLLTVLCPAFFVEDIFKYALRHWAQSRCYQTADHIIDLGPEGVSVAESIYRK